MTLGSRGRSCLPPVPEAGLAGAQHNYMGLSQDLSSETALILLNYQHYFDFFIFGNVVMIVNEKSGGRHPDK